MSDGFFGRKKKMKIFLSEENNKKEGKKDDVKEEINYDFLDKLNEILNNDTSFVENIKYLNKAKVPIIKILKLKKIKKLKIA